MGAACPVLLSAIGTNKNGKRTALVYLLNDLFGMLLWSVIFYGINAIVHFPFMNMTMSPVSIAILNSVFRIATVLILFPFIKYIEKLVFFLVKDNAEEQEDQRDFDLLEERFLDYPALAITQSHLAVNGMAKKARKNILRALGLLTDFSQERYLKVQEKEKLLDKYEDRLGTYLMQLTGREMMTPQIRQVSVFLHTITDFERLGDHAVNIANTAKELYEKKITFSEEAIRELKILEEAVKEILELAVGAFCSDDNERAKRVEPLRELIMVLCNELKSRHIIRLRVGKCDLKQGFSFNNLLTDLERIAAHCSNIAVAMIETEAADFDTHRYLESIREMDDEEYFRFYEEYEKKYQLHRTRKAEKR